MLKRILGNLLLAAAGVVIALVMVEVGLRIADISFFGYHLFDDSLGWVRPAGAEGWYRREGKAYIRINAQGQRDWERTVAKPADTLRIAVLGDSMTEALQVDMDKVYTTQVERALSSCPAVGGRKVEVLNFGVTGYSTAQELAMWRERAMRYAPDIVVLQFAVLNDVAENSRAMSPGDLRPFYVYQNDQLVLDDSFHDQPAFKVRQGLVLKLFYGLLPHSRILQVINEIRALADIRQQEGQLAAGKGGAASPTANPSYRYEAVYLEPADPNWREGWRVTEDLITLLRGEVTAKGARFMVIITGTDRQAYHDPEVPKLLQQQLKIPDLYYPNRRIIALGQSKGFPVLDLTPGLTEYAQKNNRALHGFGDGYGHWNEEGHRVAAELLTQRLCSDIIPR